MNKNCKEALKDNSYNPRETVEISLDLKTSNPDIAKLRVLSQ